MKDDHKQVQINPSLENFKSPFSNKKLIAAATLPARKLAALVAANAGLAATVLLVAIAQGEAVGLAAAQAAAAVAAAIGAAGGQNCLQGDDVAKGADVGIAGQRQRTLYKRRTENKETLSKRGLT
jgi:hypothetical protein